MSLELETLLSPICDQYPCGTDYSFSNEFQAIKIAKTQDDALLEQGDWVLEPKQADWSFVATQSSILLSEKTKDIRIYTWLLEAWSKLYGYEGISKSLELLQKTLGNYWLQIHPEIQDDDLDQRIGLLQGFIGLLPVVLKKVPVVGVAPYFNLIDYDTFLYQQNQKRKYQQDIEDENIDDLTIEQFEHALSSTSKHVQYQNYQHFLTVLEYWNQLKATLDQLMGLDSPSFAYIDTQIDSIQLNLKKIYKVDLLNIAQTKQTASENHKACLSFDADQMKVSQVVHAKDLEHSNYQFQVQPQNHMANRQHAMQTLKEISDYFQLNEPHSPVSYMLQKTIKWSQMPLHEWLTQVIKNENPLENIQEALGVQNNVNDW